MAVRPYVENLLHFQRPVNEEGHGGSRAMGCTCWEICKVRKAGTLGSQDAIACQYHEPPERQYVSIGKIDAGTSGSC